MTSRKITERDALSERKKQRRETGQPDVSGLRRTARQDKVQPESPAADWQRPSSMQDAQVSKSIGGGDVKLRERHEKRKGWFLMEASRQAANRALMAQSEAFYDSEQWKQDEADEVRDRGQNPVVYNEIKPTIDWLIGTERRTRIDFSVVAEEEDPQADNDARTKQKLLKYLDDTNKAGFERSWAAEDMFKAGVGWLEVGVRGDKTNVPIYKGFVSWRDILWDSQGTKRDTTDWRYMFRVKVVDEDVAIACFPDKEDAIKRVVQTGDNLQVFSQWLGGIGLISGLDQFSMLNDNLDSSTPRPVDIFNSRRRVLLLECWSREPVKRKPSTDGMGDPVQFEVHVAIMTEHDTLIEGVSPFKHNRFPFIPYWGYKNRRTGLPYSPIRPLMGPQEALNHRMSKSLYEASANQVEIEAGAIDPEIMGPDELQAEYNDPGGMPIFANGALSGNRVRKVEHNNKVAAQLQLAERDIQTIRGMSGVTGENRGMQTNSISGKAVIAKQDQGSLVTMELFDNILFAHQLEGEMTLSLAEQFIVAPMTIRVAGETGGSQFVKLNEPQHDGTYMNDITARRAHYVVGEQPWKQSYAEAAFESLMQVLGQLSTAAPQIVINLLDLVFEMHPNLPKRAQIVNRIRKLNGQTDEEGKLTPEQAAAKQQQQVIAKAQFEAQMAMLKAKIREAEAKGAKLDAGAMKDQLSAILEAAEAAMGFVQFPDAAPIADELLKSAGFKDHQQPPPQQAPQAQPQPQQQPAPMALPAPAGMPA